MQLFVVIANSLQVKLILTIETKADNAFMPKVGIKDGTKNGTKEVSERQVLILGLIQEDGTITIPQLVQKTEISRRTILRELVVLQEKGILARC